MISACAKPIILFCDKFGKEKLQDEASSREAQPLEGHIGLGLRKSQMSKQRGPKESAEEADWWEKQRKERRRRVWLGPADLPKALSCYTSHACISMSFLLQL